jgi:hypothetical protein
MISSQESGGIPPEKAPACDRSLLHVNDFVQFYAVLPPSSLVQNNAASKKPPNSPKTSPLAKSNMGNFPLLAVNSAPVLPMAEQHQARINALLLRENALAGVRELERSGLVFPKRPIESAMSLQQHNRLPQQADLLNGFDCAAETRAPAGSTSHASGRGRASRYLCPHLYPHMARIPVDDNGC